MTPYIKKVTVGKGFFLAQFSSGATTKSHDVSCFFVAMQDKGIEPKDLDSHIGIGEMVDAGHDWKEIRRIAATFTKEKGAAA